MCFIKCVVISDQGDGFIIIYCYMFEGFVNVDGGGFWVWIVVRFFWVNVNEVYLYGSEWIFQVMVVGIVFVVQLD